MEVQVSKHVTNAKDYGLTDEQAELLYERQRRRCAICEKPFSRSRPANVDHDHSTGLVRGLLCSYCNQTIGYLHEDDLWLDAAVHHLRYPAARYAIGHVYTPDSPGAAGLTPKETP